jgi:hypothetical protein
MAKARRDEMQNCQWLEPHLVAQIEFTARFAGLRIDKEPERIVREE